MARIVSLTFETVSYARSGHFGIPREVATILGIHDGDPVELRVLWEGNLLEVSTNLASGLEVYYRQSDPSTKGLETVPAKTSLLITVWRSTEARDAEDDAEVRRAVPWDIEDFRRAFVKQLGTDEPLAALTQWAASRGIACDRFGSGITGPMYFDIDPSAGTLALFALSIKGSIEIVWRDNLDRAGAFADRAARVDLVRRMTELGPEHSEQSADTWFRIQPRVILDPAERSRLIEILDFMIERLRV